MFYFDDVPLGSGYMKSHWLFVNGSKKMHHNLSAIENLSEWIASRWSIWMMMLLPFAQVQRYFALAPFQRKDGYGRAIRQWQAEKNRNCLKFQICSCIGLGRMTSIATTVCHQPKKCNEYSVGNRCWASYWVFIRISWKASRVECWKARWCSVKSTSILVDYILAATQMVTLYPRSVASRCVVPTALNGRWAGIWATKMPCLRHLVS